MGAIEKRSAGALPSVEKAWGILAQTRSTDEVKRIRAIAQAVATVERGKEIGLDAAEIVAWADRRVGELSRELENVLWDDMRACSADGGAVRELGGAQRDLFVPMDDFA